MLLVVVMGVLSTRLVPGKTFDMPGAGRVLAHVFYLQGLLDVKPLKPHLLDPLSGDPVLPDLLAADADRDPAAPPALAREGLPGGAGAGDDRGRPVAAAAPALRRPRLFVGFWHLFIAGVLVWWAVHRPGDKLAARLAVGNLLLLGLASARHTDLALAVGVAAAALIYVAGWRGKLGGWLSARPLQALGAMSYSLYLVHNPITGAAFRGGYRLTGRSVAMEGLWFVLVTAICIVAAYLSYRLIERPSLALSHRIRLTAPAKNA
jgi:hypothetical protein